MKRWAGVVLVVLLATTAFGLSGAHAYEKPLPGSPEALKDWRWVARPPAGTRHLTSDPWGRNALPETDGGYVLLRTSGPGVLEHLWISGGQIPITIEVDGKVLWQGKPRDAARKKDKDAGLFPVPLIFESGSMVHLLAPIGFERSLRVLAERRHVPHFLSWRTFAEGTEVVKASGDPQGEYSRGLQGAAAAWRKGAYRFGTGTGEDIERAEQHFVLPAQGRASALQLHGSGELTHLEFHIEPPLTGTLREVVAEIHYGNRTDPSLRLPLTDLVGATHPWTTGRWTAYVGALPAGLRYPWYVHRPRIYHGEATFYFNLPIPFARGLRIELLNRSDGMQFHGFTRAVRRPLEVDRAARAGRLCGTRVRRPIAGEPDPAALLSVPGPGRLVGLSLFLTGNELRMPPAKDNGIVSLTIDAERAVRGHGILPLWMQGRYGGPRLNQPIWSHPRLEHNFCGVARYFQADPIPFQETLEFGYTPGTDSKGAPDRATAVALWYEFGDEPYAAPSLPEHAPRLPYTDYGQRVGHPGPGRKTPRVFWAKEAEDLLPMGSEHGMQAWVAEDVMHNYHPSEGRYLHAVFPAAGAYLDCVVEFPRSRYFSLGTNSLWGSGSPGVEADVLSLQNRERAPEMAQGQAFYRGRVVGSVPMKARVYPGNSGRGHRRDPNPMYTPPLRNPAPGSRGILRFVCRSTSRGHIMKLDQAHLVTPPAAEAGWRQFENSPLPQTNGHMTARFPRYGRFRWSEWGALVLSSADGGTALIRELLPVAGRDASKLLLRGSLGAGQGAWTVQTAEAGRPEELSPGKDPEEMMEWEVPLDGVEVPGPLTLKVTCMATGGKQDGGKNSRGRLVLDAWAVR